MTTAMRLVPRALAILVPLLAIAVLWWKLDQVQSNLGRLLGIQQTVRTEASSAGDSIVLRTPGGLLEVARIKAYERFTRSDSKTWGPFDLGTTVSEIEVPALFRYQIEMAKQWPMACDEKRCIVHAGEPQPALPAGIYTDEVKKRTANGWARFNRDENMAALERSVAAQLGARANSERNRAAARNAGRQTVREFVKTWVLKDPALGRIASRRVVVLFPGEAATEDL